ncbi:MAG: hypothetical protein ACEQSC_01010 [Candidatus Nanopelagicaceae bacterium]
MSNKKGSHQDRLEEANNHMLQVTRTIWQLRQSGSTDNNLESFNEWRRNEVVDAKGINIANAIDKHRGIKPIKTAELCMIEIEAQLGKLPEHIYLEMKENIELENQNESRIKHIERSIMMLDYYLYRIAGCPYGDNLSGMTMWRNIKHNECAEFFQKHRPIDK